MNTGQPILTGSITAAADLVKCRFIGFNGGLCGANAKAAGVSEAETKTGQQCPITMVGMAIVESGGIIAAGGEVTSDALGRAVAATALAVASAITTEVETTVDTDVTTTVDPTVTVTVAVPTGETPVTSSGAQPDLTETVEASATAESTATSTGTSTAESTAVNTVSGAILPQKINGRAYDAATGAGQFIRVLLAA